MGPRDLAAERDHIRKQRAAQNALAAMFTFAQIGGGDASTLSADVAAGPEDPRAQERLTRYAAGDRSLYRKPAGWTWLAWSRRPLNITRGRRPDRRRSPRRVARRTRHASRASPRRREPEPPLARGRS